MRKTRVVNLRQEKYDVYIGRTGKVLSCNSKDSDKFPKHFGNPFKIGRNGDREIVIWKHKQWLQGKYGRKVEPERRQWILDNLCILKGKRLGCFCAPDACHGDTYVSMVERRCK